MRKTELGRELEEGLRRHRIIAPLLLDGLSESEKDRIRQLIYTQEGISSRTLRRNILAYKQGGFEALLPRDRKDKGSCRAIPMVALDLAINLRQELPNRSVEKIQLLLANKSFIVARSTLEKQLRIRGFSGRELMKQFKPLVQIEPTRWMLRVLQNAYSYSEIKNDLGEIKELKSLLQFATFGKFNERNMALSILARSKGIPTPTISQFLNISPRTIRRYFNRYKADNFNISTFAKPKTRLLKSDKKECVDAVFSLLHHPPSEFGINRTSWKLMDLKHCLQNQGVSLSKKVIEQIIWKADYKWRKARIVLTSTDPNYRQKLENIKNILSSLKNDERFFSCDEFGPFAVKMMSGRKLVAPDEYPQVAQYQKSRGSLILTGALELSTNQITHFYSEKKDTGEMIRLLDVLLNEYKSVTRIYISWDSASWHISKKFNLKVEEVNDKSYRQKYKTPEAVMAPLPASAQFLNVIESVFSGLARAVIHNSNYGSVDEAKAAIDKHFAQRNKYFQEHPKIAGKKIWGQERTPSQFDETQNCKDILFR